MSEIVWTAEQLRRWETIFAEASWHALPVLRESLGGRALGFFSSEQIAFAAVQSSETRRSLAVIGLYRTLVTFDYAVPTPSWRIEPAAGWRQITVSRELHVLSHSPKSPKPVNLTSIDLSGLQLGDFVILFHSEGRMSRSPVSFDTAELPAGSISDAGNIVKVLVSGLAPGAWEIWRNGWLIDPDAPVPAEAGCLYFEGRPGSYFLRRLSY